MEEIQLKDICDLDNGYAFKSDDYIDNSNTLNCRMSNIRPDGSFDILYSAKYLPDDFAEKYKDYILHDGDLIIAMTDMAGDPKILGVPTVVDTQGYCLLLNQRVGRLRFIRDGVNADYLKLALQCPKVRTYLKRFAGGGVQLNVSKKDILSAPVCMRNEEEQNHIAGLFKRVLEVKTKREQELQLLDDLIKARFVELFGDPVSNPKGWNMVELGELTGIGSSKRIFEKEYVSEGIPFYRTKEIVELSKGNSISTELYITEERFAEIKKQYGVPKAGDLLISAVGTIGVIWIVDGKNDFYFKDGNLIRVDGSEKFNSVYMKNLLEHLIAEYKKQMSSGTAYAALTISGLTKMKVYDVPMDLQNYFADFVHQVDKSKVAVQKSLDETQQLFDSLMQKYFG